MTDKNPGLTIKFIYKTRPPAIEKQKVGMIIKEETSKEELCRNIDLIKYEVNKGTSILIDIGFGTFGLVFKRIFIDAECVGYVITLPMLSTSNVSGNFSLFNRQKTDDYFLANELDFGIRIFINRAFSNNPNECIYRESNLFDLIQNHVIENKLKEFDGVIKY